MTRPDARINCGTRYKVQKRDCQGSVRIRELNRIHCLSYSQSGRWKLKQIGLLSGAGVLEWKSCTEPLPWLALRTTS